MIWSLIEKSLATATGMANVAIKNIQVCWVFVAVQVSRVNLYLLLVEVVVCQAEEVVRLAEGVVRLAEGVVRLVEGVVRLAEGVVRLAEAVVRLAGEAAKCLVLGGFRFSMLAGVAMDKVKQEIADMKELVLIEVSIITLETFNTKALMAEVLMSKVHVDPEVAIVKQLVLVEAEVSRLAEAPVAMVDQENADVKELVLVKVKFTRLAGG